jgi:thiol-disulfide isomerase/thioredoxin
VYSLVIGQAKWKFQPKRILEDGMLSKADVWRITAVGLALLAGSFMTAGQEVGGLQPGAMAPSFTLQDQTGKTQNLSSLTGPKGLVLLFFRSADWCPFCKGQLVDLERSQNAFAAKGIQIAALSYDSPAILSAAF